MRTVVFLVLLSGCASQVRFADRLPAWSAHDDHPSPLPKKRQMGEIWMHVHAELVEPVQQVLSIVPDHEARNANALDEVPDSTWFDDRRRRAALAGKAFVPADVAANPPEVPAPGDITIIERKPGGHARGFVGRDVRGRRFVFQIDDPGQLGITTSTEVVSARLVAAAGWRVSSVSLVELRPSQILIGMQPKKGHPYVQRDLDRLFASAPRLPDGRYRFSARAIAEGTPVGPFSYEGRRHDDTNDRVDHESRRDLRGYRVFASWINDVGTVDSSTLDTYVGEPGHGHLVHTIQDLSGSFGSYAGKPVDTWMGFESYFDGRRVLGSIFAFGGYTRPWSLDSMDAERERVTNAWPELGWFEAVYFDPTRWEPLWPNPAFERATDRDHYWGAKRMLSLTEAEVKAAIAVGHYSAEVADRLFEVLWARRDKIARAYLTRIAPFEDLRFEHDSLCFDDLMVKYGFDTNPAEYTALGSVPVQIDANGRRCTALSPGDGYHVVVLGVRRASDRRVVHPLGVHYVEKHGTRHIVGLVR